MAQHWAPQHNAACIACFQMLDIICSLQIISDSRSVRFVLQGDLRASIFSNSLKLVSGPDPFVAGQEVNFLSPCSALPCPASYLPCLQCPAPPHLALPSNVPALLALPCPALYLPCLQCPALPHLACPALRCPGHPAEVVCIMYAWLAIILLCSTYMYSSIIIPAIQYFSLFNMPLKATAVLTFVGDQLIWRQV